MNDEKLQLDGEIWKDVVSYEGLYQVSNLGRIKRLSKVVIDSIGRTRHLKESIGKQRLTPDGYLKIGLTNNFIRKEYFIHRLVAITFELLNPENKRTINHKDGNKLNNNLDNLEWATDKEQMQHALINNLRPIGENVGTAKLKTEQVLKIRELYNKNKTTMEISKILTINYQTARAIIKRRIWKHI